MVPSDERPVITLSVIPAIDALVADMSGRGLVAGTEIVDRVDRAANG
jgi:thymidine phosphorylase